jgi:thiamine-phosphate pyrophosphorylase
MHQMSPGAERAVEAARLWAARLGAGEVRLADLVLGLLDEEEGRPAVLLERLGVSIPAVRQALAGLPVGDSPPAPLDRVLDAARDWSLAHRADPAFMTDALLITALRADDRFRHIATPLGLDPDRLEEAASPPADRPTTLAHERRAPLLPDPAPDMGAARVLDANFNRAREALRVLEDYCRFVLDDRFLTGQAKAMRHALAGVANRLPPGVLLAARDTLRDVGTTVSAAGEYDRRSAAEVAAVNLKRLQESLRSLEEYGKVLGADLGRECETVRYQCYSLERAVVRGDSARTRLSDTRLYVILTGSQCRGPLDWTIQQAAAGGATVFQLREKALSDRGLLERAREVRRWTRQAGALFIVNDRPDIARLAEADGVHLGQDDLSVKDARRILGAGALIGVSTHDIGQVRQAVLDGADYLGVGPTFPSQTKTFEHFPGLQFVRQVSSETSMPAFALGGIGPDTIAAAVRAGATRVAVSAAVIRSEDPQAMARLLRAALGG